MSEPRRTNYFSVHLGDYVHYYYCVFVLTCYDDIRNGFGDAGFCLSSHKQSIGTLMMSSDFTVHTLGIYVCGRPSSLITRPLVRV